MNLQKDLLEFIGNHLQASEETVSTAESVTAGFLQFSFSQIKDASQFFKGGITAYTIDEKVKFLQIDEEEGKQSNCVSQNISDAMALNVAKLFGTDWGIAVTGYATPVEESEYKLFAYFSFSYKNQIILSQKMDLNSRKDSISAQLCYSEFIIECLKVEMDKQISLREEIK
ncbi:amidohydrolase, PncC family [Chryseobacterium arachidis]|uniref:Amidohydrolase, PncC family n=1 Tax=Chryseobacterium arachidis TaxID=1416778 RepID=A0A1M4V723_9FLAO|nr:nicotinamide-nucleotide amidohydrolase family protein [Chryseobacterium arachidis]SHE64759.1 amidohydrolase, PncC family [Chryseobacterium arachidis]